MEMDELSVENDEVVDEDDDYIITDEDDDDAKLSPSLFEF
jgi:hypothetical protein